MKPDYELLEQGELKEINFLKKINKKIFSLKLLLTVFVIILILVLFVIGFKKISEAEDGKQVLSIIQEAYNSIQDFKNQNKFLLATSTSTANSKYYYKDGKYKEEIEFLDNSLGCTLKYGKLANNALITINFWEYAQIINGQVSENLCVEDKEFKFEQVFSYLYELNKKDLFSCSNITLSEEIFDNEACYILEDKSYILVISKETMLIKRYSELNPSNTYWINYDYEIANISNEDIKLKDFENYEIIDIPKRYLDEF